MAKTLQQTHLISRSQALIILWNNNKKKYFKKTSMWILCFLLAYSFILMFVGLGIGIFNGSTTPLERDNVIRLGGIVDWMIEAIINALSRIIWEFLIIPLIWIIDGTQEIFLILGGAGIIQAMVKTQPMEIILGVVGAVSAALAVLAIGLRGWRMLQQKYTETNIVNNTPAVIIAAALGVVIITPIFLWICGLMTMLLMQILQSIGLADQKLSLIVFNCSFADGMKNYTYIPGHAPKGFVYLVGVLGEIAAAYILVKFVLFILFEYFSIIVMYLAVFAGFAKWPEDEGAAAMAIKDDIVGNFIQIFLIYMFFGIYMVIIAGLESMMKTFEGKHQWIVMLLGIIAGGKICLDLPDKLKERFMIKGNLTSDTAGLIAGTGGKMGKYYKTASKAKDSFIKNDSAKKPLAKGSKPGKPKNTKMTKSASKPKAIQKPKLVPKTKSKGK